VKVEREEIVIHLILQDLRHNRVLLGLESIGLAGTETLFLDVFRVAVYLMEIDQQKLTEEVQDTYNAYLDAVLEVEFNKLPELATEVFQYLEKATQ
jgi:hypothetical protein